MGQSPPSRPAGVWYAAVTCEDVEPERWRVRVTMTADVAGGARQEREVVDVEGACELLRQWYLAVTGDA